MSAKILDFEEYRVKKLKNQLYDEASILVNYINLDELQETLSMLKNDLKYCSDGYMHVLKSEIELIELAIEIHKK